MKSALLRILLTSSLLGVAWAQNSDIALLVGSTGPVSVPLSLGRTKTSISSALQINYAAQLHETGAGQLYLELPLVVAASVNTSRYYTANNGIGDDIFFAPGLRWRFAPQKRIVFYADAGGGVATLRHTDVYAGSGNHLTVRRGRAISPTVGLGGGLDFRLTRLLSFRGDVRDFVTRDLAGTAGRHHWFLTFGTAFHF